MNVLTDEEKRVILGKGTEAPFSGEYDNFYKDGTYICRQCNAPLYSAKAKFDAGCGWPAFDENLPAGRQGFPEAVKRIPDADGRRTEIECANCGGHLGHVFTGEQMTDKNTRHCVNSQSIKFIPDETKLPELLKES
jgi:methionine-R-sulfoxide reductase